MKKKLNVFLLGILAGAAIGLGSLLFTILNTHGLKSLGSVMFAVGLFSVCFFGFFLYTGKVGFFLDDKNKKAYAINLLVGYVGNIVGAVAFGYLMRLIFMSFHSETMEGIKKIVSSRLVDLGNGGSPAFKQLGTSFFCGVLVYLAVHFWKKPLKFVYRTIILVMCVFLFVYFGYEHCIANMFYFSYGNAWGAQALINILLVTIGNSFGALFVRLIVVSNK